MKKIIVIFLVLLLLTPIAFAKSWSVMDYENVLNDVSKFNRQLSALSEEYSADIFVVTATNFGNKTAEEYAIETGCDDLTLNVWGFNSGAKAFYEANGMSVQRMIMEKKLK